MSASAIVRRGFVDLAGGQVHYRFAGADTKDAASGPPLVMIHASPGSARMLEPLIGALGKSRPVYAPDTLGNGDSAPPPGVTRLEDRPPLEVFVQGHMQALDALGLEVFDLYGTHTGANIAAEIAIAWPQRVRRLVLDGVSLYSEAERAEMLAEYAPGAELSSDGAHLLRLWHFVRDAYLFWPWYRRSRPHLRGVGLPDVADLHEKAIEVLKAAQTFHYAYNAAFAYRKEDRLPLVRTPTLLTCAAGDMLLPYMDPVAALMPHAVRQVSHGGAAERAGEIAAFLNQDGLDQDRLDQDRLDQNGDAP